MKNKLRAFLLAGCVATAAFTLASCNAPKTETPQLEGYNLLWSDEFDGNTLDETIWNREVRPAGWTNNELQRYVTDEKNGFLRDGKLVIKGIEDSEGYTSCKLNTRGKKDFMYGKVVVSAKVPKGKGLWPAIWMMPKDEDVYGQWPKCGEIDIMEVLGSETYRAYGTIHYGEPHAEQQGKVELLENLFSDSFHEYAVDWTPGEIKWYIDGECYLIVNDWFTAVEGQDEKEYPAPFNQLFSLQLNLAIGGTWPGNPEKGAEYMKNAEFEVDYVRVYQKPSYDTNVKKPQKTFRLPDETGNYINNGDFAVAEKLDDLSDWGFLTAQGGKGTASIANNMVTINTEASGTEDYGIQLLHYSMPFEKGKKYSITFDCWASEARTINEVCIDAPNAGWSRYWKVNDLAITTERQTFTYTFDMTSKSDNAARFEFNLGNNPSTATVYVANVRIEEVK